MELNKSPTQYVISLDSIDLAFISTVTKYKSPGITEIWTNNVTSGGNKYYEFQIMEELQNEVDDLHYHDNSNTQYTKIPCHICNIGIPNIFFKDHINSEKHKAHQKIINISLDRMKKCLNNEPVNENTISSKSIYFCGSCAAVVETIDRIAHENSSGHKKSLEIDTVLCNFLDLYTENKEIVNVEDNKKKLFGNKSLPATENSSNKTLSEQSTIDEENELTHTNNTSHKNNVTVPPEIQKAVELSATNVNGKSTKDCNGPEVVPCDQIVMKRYDTHIKDDSFYCAICKMYMPNHNYNIYTHHITKFHAKNVKKIATDELVHLPYNLDLTKFPQIECLPCQRPLPLNNLHNVTAHMLGRTHKIEYKLSLSNNKIKITRDIYYCLVCDCPIIPMLVQAHCATYKHTNKLKVIS